jgi:hypothetical protein
MINSKIRELNDTDLDEVSGGMTCDQAHTLANIYLACAIGLGVAGKQALSDQYKDKATGVLQGGCF